MFGHPHHQISTQWTFVFGPFWRQMPVLLVMCQLKLKSSLQKAWVTIPQETLCKAAEGFCGRLERVIQARGGHIE